MEGEKESILGTEVWPMQRHRKRQSTMCKEQHVSTDHGVE